MPIATAPTTCAASGSTGSARSRRPANRWTTGPPPRRRAATAATAARPCRRRPSRTTPPSCRGPTPWSPPWPSTLARPGSSTPCRHSGPSRAATGDSRCGSRWPAQCGSSGSSCGWALTPKCWARPSSWGPGETQLAGCSPATGWRRASSGARGGAKCGVDPRGVLLVAKVRAGGHAYYLEPTGVGDRPATEAPGWWVGRGAGGLGLSGKVAPESFAAVLSGSDPHSGPISGLDRRRVQVHAYDLTFCAPQSVSLLHALSEPDVSEAVGRGHGQAVAAGVEYLEDHALTVRRPRGEARRVPVPADSAPAAAFVHRTSRALDPHLHTHVVLANVGRSPEGTWSALDGRGLYAHAAAAGALYQAQLRHELTESLGVTWGPLVGGRADVAGIGPDVRRAFSQRSEQIAAHLAARGIVAEDEGRGVSRRATNVAGLSTRAPKETGLTVDELRPWWRERAHDAG